LGALAGILRGSATCGIWLRLASDPTASLIDLSWPDDRVFAIYNEVKTKAAITDNERKPVINRSSYEKRY
jgi:hypothetical protein